MIIGKKCTYLHPLGGVVADLRGNEAETSGGRRVPRWGKSQEEALQHTRRHLPNPKFNRLSDRWITREMKESFVLNWKLKPTPSSVRKTTQTRWKVGPTLTIQLGWPMFCWPIKWIYWILGFRTFSKVLVCDHSSIG